MKVMDVVNIMDPWQDIIIRREEDTQLSEPLFERNALNIGAIPTDECMNLTISGIDACWDTIVLYTVK